MNVFTFIQRLLVAVWTLMNVPRPPVEMAPPAKTWRMHTAACVQQDTWGHSVRATLMSVPLNHVKMAPRKQWNYKSWTTVNQLLFTCVKFLARFRESCSRKNFSPKPVYQCLKLL